MGCVGGGVWKGWGGGVRFMCVGGRSGLGGGGWGARHKTQGMGDAGAGTWAGQEKQFRAPSAHAAAAVGKQASRRVRTCPNVYSLIWTLHSGQTRRWNRHLLACSNTR